jgi:scyllo-inositol 2-dehydrogenase (NADP+)
MAFYNNVYEAVTEGKDLLVNPEDAMHNIGIIEAAIESNMQKKLVDIRF